MAKVSIINAADNTRVPFLRGILTRSLSDAGLAFDEAYAIATVIRDRLDGEGSITSDALRSFVAEHLERHYGREQRQLYDTAGLEPTPILVMGRDGTRQPFSKPQHLTCLESCGLDEDEANSITRQILQHLRDDEVTEIRSADLAMLTYRSLESAFGRKAAHRYLVWVEHQRSGRPLVLLIGGTTGSGKSTVATEVAHRLGIVRTQSTDMLREVMRMMIPQRLLPVLHASSFNAGEALPGGTQAGDEYPLADGYLTQSELLSVPCEAVVQRALRERVSVILEGVHVHPALLDRIQDAGDAVVVMVMLAVLKPEQLRKRLSGRLRDAPLREASGHLELFDRIWRLQSFLLSEADRNAIPILLNQHREKVIGRVMTTVIDTLAKDFDKTAEAVFYGDTTPERDTRTARDTA